MPKDFSRTERVGDLIQKELAQLIQHEVNDPRVGVVTVSAVTVSKDFAYAKVYISALGSEQEIVEVVAVLNHASGYLRHKLSQIIKIRVTPQLQFVFDDSITRGHKLNELIDYALENDKKKKVDDCEE